MLSPRSQDIPDIVTDVVKKTVFVVGGDVTEITIYPQAPDAPDIIGCVRLDCPI